MFHRKSRKQKKNEEQNTIQNISLPVNLLASNFSASQPTISFNNELFSPSLGITATVSPYNDPSYSLSQPVINSPLNSPLNSPINPNYQLTSPSSRFINPIENRLNSPPQPNAHNLPSAIFGYSANTIDRSKMSGVARTNLVERPNRSISVRNQDFVYNTSSTNYANAIGTLQRGRSSNRDYDSYESNNSFLNFTKHVQFEREDGRSDRDSNSKRSDRDSASKRSDRDSTSKRSDRDEKGSEKDEKRPSRDRPLASKSQKPPKPFERVQSRYNEIKNRAAAAAAGDISILSDFGYSDRLNRKYNLDSGNNSFAVYDTISRSRSEKTPTSSRGKYEPTNIEILREILHESKPSDTSFSTIDINDGHRQSVTKSTTINKKVVEESPLINFSKNPVMKNSSVGRDFGIKLDSKKNLEDYGTMTLGRHPKISHDISRSKTQLAESHRLDESFSYSLSQPENFSRTSSRNYTSSSRSRDDSPNRSFSRSRVDDINRSRIEDANRSFSRSRADSPPGRSASRKRDDSPNRSFSRSRIEDSNRSRYDDANRSFSRRTDSPPGRSKSRSRADSPPGRSKSRSRADSPPGRSKSRSRTDSPPGRSKSRSRGDSPNRSFSRSHNDDINRSFSRSRLEEANRSFSRSRMEDANRSFSRSRTESPNRSFSRSRMEDANRSFSRSRMEDISRSGSRSRTDSPPGRSKSRSRADSPPRRSKSRTRADSPPGRSKSRSRADSPPGRSKSRHHATTHNRTVSKSTKPVNMNDFFNNLESEIDITINATFNTADSLIANKKDDVVEVVEEDFTEPITEENKDGKDDDGKKKRISNDVLGLVLGINSKDEKPRPDIIIEEEPDTEDEGDEKPPLVPVLDDEVKNKILSELDGDSSQEGENEAENNENKLKIITSQLEINKSDNGGSAILSAIEDKPEKPISPLVVLGRSDSRNSNHVRNLSTDSKVSTHSRNLSTDGLVAKHSRNLSTDGIIAKHSRKQSSDIARSASPLPLFSQTAPLSSQPTSPTSPTAPLSENGDPELFDGISQDDIGNVSTLGRNGVLKSFLQSDIGDIIENEQDVDTLNISPEYRDNFIEYLTSQKYDVPTKDDFISVEGYYSWEEKN